MLVTKAMTNPEGGEPMAGVCEELADTPAKVMYLGGWMGWQSA